MKRANKAFLALFLVSLTLNLPAQVNREEMENLGPVEFINYEGPFSSRNDTRAQIRAIGYSLGIMIRAGQPRAGAANRYFVNHIASGPADGRIDADVFGLGIDVAVDHIRNLRLIIQGYLEAAYAYNENDAALLAEYITVYNAVYRGDMNYFNSRLTDSALALITQDRAGLSIRYDEWPGRSLIVIPLGTGRAGSLSAIDTGSLVDPRVTDQLREDPDSGIDTRRDMVDLLERQAEEAGREAEQGLAAVRQDELRLAEDRQQLEQEGLEGEALEARQGELAQREEDLGERRAAAEETQARAEQTEELAQRERESIAADQASTIAAQDQQPPAAAADGLVGAKILNPGASLGQIVLLDPSTGRERRASGLRTVNVRTLTEANGKLIAIAGETRGNAAIRLVEIKKDTLEMAKQGEDDIDANSLLWLQNGDLYAITSSDGSLYLGRFNDNLERQARSTVTVHPFASVTVSGGSLVTQRADGTALILDPKTLAAK
uniref:Antigen, p83/100 n=1 Tax=uncultured bacterium contig00033 TaxID=1181522 RepID=A0A806KM95_9BACT|nr:antigen, p83/100 [uncultured bacterium contig00033]